MSKHYFFNLWLIWIRAFLLKLKLSRCLLCRWEVMFNILNPCLTDSTVHTAVSPCLQENKIIDLKFSQITKSRSLFRKYFCDVTFSVSFLIALHKPLEKFSSLLFLLGNVFISTFCSPFHSQSDPYICHFMVIFSYYKTCHGIKYRYIYLFSSL